MAIVEPKMHQAAFKTGAPSRTPLEKSYNAPSDSLAGFMNEREGRKEEERIRKEKKE